MLYDRQEVVKRSLILYRYIRKDPMGYIIVCPVIPNLLTYSMSNFASYFFHTSERSIRLVVMNVFPVILHLKLIIQLVTTNARNYHTIGEKMVKPPSPCLIRTFVKTQLPSSL